MKRTYQIPEIEITEVFTAGTLMTQNSEPEGGGYVGGNTYSFDDAETQDAEPLKKNLWDN
jgi:hypothetical protein